MKSEASQMKILQVCPKYYPSIGDNKMQSYVIAMM